jgi:hypothetical protein
VKLSEANAANTLISLLAGQTPYSSTPHLPPDVDQVFHAVLTLAMGAHKVLGAGWTPGTAAEAVRPRLVALCAVPPEGRSDVPASGS